VCVHTVFIHYIHQYSDEVKFIIVFHL